MAIKVVEDMLKKAYGEARGRKLLRKARSWTDTQGYHLISITEAEIAHLISSNYVAIRRRALVTGEQKRLQAQRKDRVTRAQAVESVLETSDDVNIQRLRKEAASLATHIFKNFVKEYNKGIRETHLKASQHGNSIRILQPSNLSYKVKAAMKTLLESKSTGTLLDSITKGKAGRSFDRRTQFVHLGRTVGRAIAENLGDLEPTSQAEKEAQKVIENILDRTEFRLRKLDQIQGQDIYIEGFIGPSTINAPGAESSDWKHLRPLIEEELQQVLSSKEYTDKFGSGPGSQPFDERLAKYVANEQVLKKAKGRRTKADAPFKIESPRNKTGSVKKRNTQRASAKKTTVRPGKKINVPPKNVKTKNNPASVPMNLIGVINQRLPEVVAQNMRYPALEYRTGRFANSARVTDMAKTAQGFTSIGYTYQTNPYQTFEPGYQQGSPDRDPRKLIDRSIREIAAHYAMGRFYTRRV